MRGLVHVKWLLCLGLAGMASLATTPARARTEAETGYSKAQTFSGVLRYLRVDLGYEVVEKDPEVAYVLFRFVQEGNRDPMTGSIEIIEAGEGARLLLQLASLPEYYETLLRDGLLRKLRAEYGEPIRHPKSSPKEKQEKEKGEAEKKAPKPEPPSGSDG